MVGEADDSHAKPDALEFEGRALCMDGWMSGW